ncbi:MAG: PDZ domain-containing protein [Planctomycetota bacterium]|nr:MAG: PDZ domain-containing protein [Planctomycetota bacterium]
MKSIRAERFLAGLVSIVVAMILLSLCDGLSGLAPLACADQSNAPSRGEAKPARPRMEAMPPTTARPPRRPFDDAEELKGEEEPRDAATDNQRADRAPPATAPRRLGTTFAPVPDAVREQIDLPKGVGLLVDSVEPGSPAAAAGLKRFDILTRFNDQIVCNADQLATLLTLRKPGPLPMTILRGGRERKIQVILLQPDQADQADDAAAPGGPPGILPGFRHENLPGDLQKQMEDLARQIQKQPFALGGGAGRSRTTQMSVSPQGNERIDTESDGTTTIEIRQSAGMVTVEIRGADNAKLYANKLDTDGDIRRVPEEFRGRVERLLEEITAPRR